MNTENWTLLDTFTNAYEAELQRGYLEENGILAVVLNEKDSSYLIGYVHLYVAKDDVDAAKELINNLQLE